MKAITYALFGHERGRQENCFDFGTYLRGLCINIRLARLLYPDWKIILETDHSTNEKWGGLFSKLPIITNVNEDSTPLTKAMLWRLKPSFEMEGGKWKYSHIICRDLDSPLTYREAQAVYYWISKDTAMHAITDSISHTIPLMGGMIGVRPDYFNNRTNAKSWNELMSFAGSIDFSRKGNDQTFLNQYIYPKFAQKGNESITQHYFKGMSNTFLSGYVTCTCESIIGHNDNCPNNITIGIPENLKESNQIAGHIGASGYYEGELFRFLRKHWDQFWDLYEIERNPEYNGMFFWTKEN